MAQEFWFVFSMIGSVIFGYNMEFNINPPMMLGLLMAIVGGVLYVRP